MPQSAWLNLEGQRGEQGDQSGWHCRNPGQATALVSDLEAATGQREPARLCLYSEDGNWRSPPGLAVGWERKESRMAPVLPALPSRGEGKVGFRHPSGDAERAPGGRSLARGGGRSVSHWHLNRT